MRGPTMRPSWLDLIYAVLVILAELVNLFRD
jgi:hypothetical protein